MSCDYNLQNGKQMHETMREMPNFADFVIFFSKNKRNNCK